MCARHQNSISYSHAQKDTKEGIVKGGGVAETDPRLGSFLDRLKYFQTNFDDDDGFERLKHYLADLESLEGKH